MTNITVPTRRLRTTFIILCFGFFPFTQTLSGNQADPGFETGESHVYNIDKINESIFLLNWLISGPFPNGEDRQSAQFTHDERCVGFFTDYLESAGGERRCAPNPGDMVNVPGLNINHAWQIYRSRTKIINLQDIYPASDQIISYAFCKIYSATQRKLGLAIGSNDGLRVFLNGDEIHLVHPASGRGVNRDDDLIEILLKEGDNNLLLKIENGFGEFAFIVRLVELGSPLAGLIKTKGQPVTLSGGELTAVIIDNYAFGDFHRAGYNGIAGLRHSAQDSNIFVPEYAGFNLEHIFNCDSLVQLFEPRRNAMSIKKFSETEAELHQPVTPVSGVESWTKFTIVAPRYIDITFRVVVRSPDFFKKGPAGLFWASYINSPPDKNIYFWGRKKQEASDNWIGAFSPAHGVQSTHISLTDTLDFITTPGFNVVLANHYSDYFFSESFYFGRFYDMVFAYLFAAEDDQIIRFSQSPNGGGGPNPAWDFQFIIPDVQPDRQYKFNCRLIYKKYIDAEDIRQEFNIWRQQSMQKSLRSK